MRLAEEKSSRTAPRPRLSKGEVRRLLAMLVIAVVVLIFIGQSIAKMNYQVDRQSEPVEVGQPPQERPEAPPPEDRPDGSQIVIPGEGDPKAFSKVKDHSDLEVDEPALLYLVKTVMELDKEQTSARVDYEAGIPDYFLNPAEYRGRFVRVAGRLDVLEPLWLPLDNPSGVDKAWWGILSDRHMRPVQFVALEKEREFSVGQDTVQLEGPFFKIRTYVSVVGKRVNFPLLVARRMQSVQEITYEEAFPKSLGYLVAGLVAVVLAVIGIASWRVSRRDAAADRSRRSKGNRPAR